MKHLRLLFSIFIVTVAFGCKGKIGKSIGLVEIEGIIHSSKQIIKDLDKCKKNPMIKAIVVRINSPGGTVVPCQEIYQLIRKIEKPTVASLGIAAASGGYYIACACDQIVSNPGTMTGSIGVLMEIPNVAELIKKIGIKFNVIKSRPYKDIGSPYRDMTPKEEKLLKDVVDDVYYQFIDAVVAGRNLPRDKVLEIADGRILTGKQAKELGLVDTLGTLYDAKLIAASLAGIEGEPKVVQYRKPHRWLRRLLNSLLRRDEVIRLEYR